MDGASEVIPRFTSALTFLELLPKNAAVSKAIRLSLFVACLLFSVGRGYAEDAPLKSPWIRHKGPTDSKGVIVFVHGVLGNSKSTWSSSKAFWPELITRDHAFDGQDVYVYGYPSTVRGRTFTTDNVAENLRLFLTDEGVFDYGQITFVSHSMGGLVTRAFLLKNQLIVPKIRFLYFFGTPTTGSPYAKLAAVISNNRQFQQLFPMKSDSDSYLAPLQSNWLNAELGLKSYCAFETQPLYGQIIVERQSATNLCTKRLDPIDADHIDMVKPLDDKSTAYRALRVAFIETAPPTVLNLLVGEWCTTDLKHKWLIEYGGKDEIATSSDGGNWNIWSLSEVSAQTFKIRGKVGETVGQDITYRLRGRDQIALVTSNKEGNVGIFAAWRRCDTAR